MVRASVTQHLRADRSISNLRRSHRPLDANQFGQPAPVRHTDVGYLGRSDQNAPPDGFSRAAKDRCRRYSAGLFQSLRGFDRSLVSANKNRLGHESPPNSRPYMTGPSFIASLPTGPHAEKLGCRRLEACYPAFSQRLDTSVDVTCAPNTMTGTYAGVSDRRAQGNRLQSPTTSTNAKIQIILFR
jgi:hypothetical protein